MQQHNASISGGSDKTTYYGSIGYKGQDGILQYGTDKYKRINMSFNFSTQITKWLEVTSVQNITAIQVIIPTPAILI